MILSAIKLDWEKVPWILSGLAIILAGFVFLLGIVFGEKKRYLGSIIGALVSLLLFLGWLSIYIGWPWDIWKNRPHQQQETSTQIETIPSNDTLSPE